MSDLVDVPATEQLSIAPPRKPSLLRLIRDDIGCVRLRDPAARSELETLLTYPGIHALIWHRLAHRLWYADWRFPARLLSWFGRFVSNVDIHPGARIGKRFFIDHGACVVIGETAEIGNDVTLYHGVTLGGTILAKGKRHPTIGDRVVIGAGAKVLGAITIGEDSRIGANAVVVRSVPPNSVVVGVPGQIVRRSIEHHAADAPDLNHASLPDIVGVSLKQLLERVETLELQVEGHKNERPHVHAPDGESWAGEDFSI